MKTQIPSEIFPGLKTPNGREGQRSLVAGEDGARSGGNDRMAFSKLVTSHAVKGEAPAAGDADAGMARDVKAGNWRAEGAKADSFKVGDIKPQNVQAGDAKVVADSKLAVAGRVLDFEGAVRRSNGVSDAETGTRLKPAELPVSRDQKLLASSISSTELRAHDGTQVNANTRGVEADFEQATQTPDQAQGKQLLAANREAFAAVETQPKSMPKEGDETGRILTFREMPTVSVAKHTPQVASGSSDSSIDVPSQDISFGIVRGAGDGAEVASRIDSSLHGSGDGASGWVDTNRVDASLAPNTAEVPLADGEAIPTQDAEAQPAGRVEGRSIDGVHDLSQTVQDPDARSHVTPERTLDVETLPDAPKVRVDAEIPTQPEQALVAEPERRLQEATAQSPDFEPVQLPPVVGVVPRDGAAPLPRKQVDPVVKTPPVERVLDAASDTMPTDEDSDTLLPQNRTSVSVLRQETHFAPTQHQPIAQQVGDQVVSHLQSADGKAASGSIFTQDGTPLTAAKTALKVLHIQLQPANLGTVTVRMSVTGDTLEMQVEVAQQDTAQMLRKNQEVLTSALRASGYNVDGVAIQLVEGDSRVLAGNASEQQGGGQSSQNAAGSQGQTGQGPSNGQSRNAQAGRDADGTGSSKDAGHETGAENTADRSVYL